MTSKKHIRIIIFTSFTFVLFHIVVWFFLTSKVFVTSNGQTIGDLARLSYRQEIVLPKKDNRNLFKKHFDYSSKKPVDIITIGDSFSQGKGEGENKYYQDFIASNQNLNVLNIRPLPQGLFETVLILKNSGLLATMKPKAIIIESVERGAIKRFSKDMNWNESLSITTIEKQVLKNIDKHKKHTPNELSFINKLNYNSVLYNLLYNFDDNAYFSKVYITSLSESLFNGNCPDCLYFLSSDIKNIHLSNKESITKLNQNFNQLQTILLPDEIDLYFMPAVDKYNLYSKYIPNNIYDTSQFFELLRKEQKIYKFIDTKKSLRILTDNKIKNVYHPDDTHWSSIASEYIFENMRF
mgnify:CR=1 FL=1